KIKIFILALGIAVDDSIHFLSRFRNERKKHSFLKALEITYLNTGKAILVTSLILVGGFSTLCFSTFLGTYYLGLLLSLSLLFALIVDLTVLPALLILWNRSSKNR
ncbi:MAG: MMPL family transporter, partial [Bacteroidota bacterium]